MTEDPAANVVPAESVWRRFWRAVRWFIQFALVAAVAGVIGNRADAFLNRGGPFVTGNVGRAASSPWTSVFILLTIGGLATAVAAGMAVRSRRYPRARSILMFAVVLGVSACAAGAAGTATALVRANDTVPTPGQAGSQAVLSHAPANGQAALNNDVSEANFFRIAGDGPGESTGWQDRIAPRDGDIVHASIFFHNTSSDSRAGGGAVRVKDESLDRPAGSAPPESTTLRAFLDAFNAPAVSDTSLAEFKGEGISLVYVPDSTRLWTTRQRGARLPDGVMDSGVSLGTLDPGDSGYITFDLRATGPKTVPAGQVIETSL